MFEKLSPSRLFLLMDMKNKRRLRRRHVHKQDRQSLSKDIFTYNLAPQTDEKSSRIQNCGSTKQNKIKNFSIKFFQWKEKAN